MSLQNNHPIYDLLRKMRQTTGMESLKRLFWTELSYDRVDQSYPYNLWTSWPESAREALVEPPTLFAEYNSGDDHFNVIYCQLNSDRLLITKERAVISRLIQEFPFALFIFSDEQQQHWHFVNVKYDPDDRARRLFRRITIGPNERIRVAFERIKLLDTEAMPKDMFGLSPLAIQDAHDKAFDVEDVTKTFFKEYKSTYQELQKDLIAQTRDREWAHDYALQFLNRVMFLYFVQRKLWLEVDGQGDPEFLSTFWMAYQQQAGGSDTFFQNWLSILFFEAFNNRFDTKGHSHLPENMRQTLEKAPYLNGGLFRENDLDTAYTFQITDNRFEEIYKFFESYNFTISEDTPLDQEVAVDPEMIGKVYESLVNVSEDTDERSDAGIFYTPRTEIDLMCRLSLVDWLANHLGDAVKPQLYDAVFAFTEDEKHTADEQLRNQNLWTDVHRLLTGVQIVDPACGSGSFLVGMLMVLDDLLRRANDELGHRRSVDERRRDIIGRNLYGVDVMDWAVHVAELRLWLQLVIETDIHPAKLQMEPLLPNLSFKIRNGDSLVQEIGGMNLAVRHGGLLPDDIRGEINHLRGEKLKFYNNMSQYKTVDELKQAEFKLFRQVIDGRATALNERIAVLEKRLKPRTNLFGDVDDPQLSLEHAQDKRELEQRQTELEQVQRAQAALQSVNDVPFVWDVAFVEVFEGERQGFDIVIGNPPYVRQEEIKAPYEPLEKVTRESKKAYKEKLAKSVYHVWPKTFSDANWSLDSKSDLYIYFYFHSLSILNKRGTFCFVTSNTWLDTQYGQLLQKFLLTRGKIRFVLDNETRRSFESADVNTVIVLFGKPTDSLRTTANPKNLAKFAMFTIPFEIVLDAKIWHGIEETKERISNENYRLRTYTHAELINRGIKDDGQEFSGDKWGGKYLRAPNIYEEILNKGKDKFVRLGEIAEVRFGIKTGANAFFYLSKQDIAEWGIEQEFLVPVIKSPRECRGYKIDRESLNMYLFVCDHEPKDLKGTATLEYIQWGESEGFHQRPSTRNRNPWYFIGNRRIPAFTSPSSYSDFLRIFENMEVLVDKRMYEIYPHSEDPDLLFTLLNTSLNTMFMEVGSRTGLGQGLLDLTVYELADCPVIAPQFLGEIHEDAISSMKKRQVVDIDSEFKMQDRLKLDEIVFDALGLTSIERDDAMEATLKLVHSRIEKAESV